MGSRLCLQVKIVLTDQRCNLTDLVGLGLAMNLLQGQDLRHTRAREDAMTAPTAYLP